MTVTSAAPLAEDAVGEGPEVLLVHGVGVGPAPLGPVALGLAGAGYRAVVVHRPGYGRASDRPLTTLADQVDGLAGRAASPGVAGVVGVSGGATLALLLAMRPGGGHLAVVAHEPLLGPLAPALHHRVRRAVSTLGRTAASEAAATAFVRRLVGEATWSRLPAQDLDDVAARAGPITAEALAFAEVAATPDDLSGLRRHGRLTTTVGATSGAERRSAAEVLRSLAGARVAEVPGAGHLAHVDAPDAFTAAVVTALAAGAADGGAP
jgi:pimeloyl-ACP methyl ester carboxylesterase